MFASHGLSRYKGYYGVALAKSKDVAAPVVAAAQKEAKKGKDAAKAKPAAEKKAGTAAKVEKKKLTDVTEEVRKARSKHQVIDPHVADQIKVGRVLARITSRPGQTGVADGYILEGAELAFYSKKIQKRK